MQATTDGDRPATDVPTDALVREGMRRVLNRIATGPQLSKDLDSAGTREVMNWIIAGRVPDVQAALFLLALRMKRETMAENVGVLQALDDACETRVTAVPRVVSLADPHNGYTRCLPMSPFLPAVLAACGVASIRPGLRSVGPKFGITDHLVLDAAGLAVDLDMRAASARLEDPAIGWSYVDQRRFAPGLHALVGLRDLMVKRSVLATAEVLLAPLRGSESTHLVAGYVHPNYPPMYLEMARAAGFDSALLVRGVEGGVIPSLQQPSRAFGFRAGGEVYEQRIAPADAGVTSTERAVALAADPACTGLDVAASARAAAQTGRAALAGEPGAARESLVLGASLVLVQLGEYGDLASAARRVREAIDCGQALARWR